LTEDTLIRDELDSFVGETLREPNWNDVVRRARPPVYRRPLVLLLVVLIAVASGAGFAAVTGGFDKWLFGQPGKPAPADEQKRFKAENGQTWLAFPTGTKLRELLRTEVAGEKYVLYGFRSGDSLCLRLNATVGREPILGCAPRSTLARTNVPLVPVAGNGWFVERNSLASAMVSFGIVADGVSSVKVSTVGGVEPAVLGGNAYLFVQSDPNTGNRVSNVTAIDNAGRASTVALTDWHHMPLFLLSSPRRARGPQRVQAPIKNPRVGWFARNEKRGYSLADVPLTPEQRANLRGSAGFGTLRLVKPDPLSNRVVGLSGDLCLVIGVGSSACNTSMREVFSRGPINAMLSSSGSSEFMGVDGVVADGITRVTIFSADGRSQSAPLRDNLFTALVPIAGFPIRVVGFDGRGRVAGIMTWPPRSTASIPTAAKKLHYVYDVFGPHGTRGIVRTGRQVNGYRCWRFSFSTGASVSGCTRRVYNQHLSVERIQPAGRDLFVLGFADKLVTRVEIHFANGDVEAAPVASGTFLLPIPRQHLKPERQVAYAVAYDRQNHRPQRQRIVFRVLR
jgi:hypothetical protein